MARVILVALADPAYTQPGYFGPGDVVVDPFGIIPDQDGVRVIRVGRRPR